MALPALKLSIEEREQLEKIVKRGSIWQERERAQSVLYLAAGWLAPQIAQEQQCNVYTVYERRKRWLQSGWEGLRSKGQGGAPSKLSEAHRALLRTWAAEEAHNASQLCAKLQQECGVLVSASTLTSTLKQMGFVWKRTRHALKKSGMSHASEKPKWNSKN